MSQKRTSVFDWQTELCHFACRIIPAGRIFLCRLISLSTSARLPHHHVTMNREARRDIAWWLRFLPSWNGRAMIPDPYWTKSPDLDSSQTPLAVLAMASSTRATGLPIPGPPNSGTDQFSGKSSIPLPLHTFSGGISGWERSSFFTATTKQ